MGPAAEPAYIGVDFVDRPRHGGVPGEWYGCPDFFSSILMTDERFQVIGGPQEFILTPDDILVAEFGFIVPMYKDAAWPPTEPGEFSSAGVPSKPGGKPEGVELEWTGFRVSLVDLETGEHLPFMRNRGGKSGSATNGVGLERPIQVARHPDGSLYVVPTRSKPAALA